MENTKINIYMTYFEQQDISIDYDLLMYAATRQLQNHGKIII